MLIYKPRSYCIVPCVQEEIGVPAVSVEAEHRVGLLPGLACPTRYNIIYVQREDNAQRGQSGGTSRGPGELIGSFLRGSYIQFNDTIQGKGNKKGCHTTEQMKYDIHNIFLSAFDNLYFCIKGNLFLAFDLSSLTTLIFFAVSIQHLIL